MRNFFSIGCRLMGLIAVLLLLAQSMVATGLPPFHAEVEKPEVKKEMPSKVSYVEAAARITVPSFFFYWIVKALALDIPDIDYHNCIAFFVNTHSFNVFYIFTSALAP